MSTDAMPERSDLSDQFVIEDLEAVKAVADPLRLRLMRLMLDTPRTVKELAAELGVPQTRLYYHIKLLEKHGLVSVASRRMVSGIEERSYSSPAGGWTISKGVMADAIDAGLLTAIFDITRAELEVALSNPGAEEPGMPGSDVPVLTFTRLWLTKDEVSEIQETLHELLARYEAGVHRPGKSEYHGALSLYRSISRSHDERDVVAP